MAKLNTEDVKREFIKNGYKPLFGEYINSDTSLLVEDIDGYKVMIRIGNLRMGKKPKRFFKNNPYTIDNIKLYLNKNNIPFTLISTEFKSACKDKLLFNCSKHGDFYSTWNNIQQKGNGCYKCRNEKISKAKTIKLGEIKNRLKSISPNIEVLNEKYYSGCKIKCRCSMCGHEWETGWGNLQQGTNCMECFKKRQRGEHHPQWRGGVTDLSESIRDCMERWRQDSFEKYGYKCDITGNNHSNLVIHHHRNFSEILKETLETLKLPLHQKIECYSHEELNNITSTCLELHYKYGLGICMESDLHTEFHSIYGFKNNTIEQYEEFKNNKTMEMKKEAS